MGAKRAVGAMWAVGAMQCGPCGVCVCVCVFCSMGIVGHRTVDNQKFFEAKRPMVVVYFDVDYVRNLKGVCGCGCVVCVGACLRVGVCARVRVHAYVWVCVSVVVMVVGNCNWQ